MQIVFQNPDAALNRRFTIQRIIARALHMLVGGKREELDTRLRDLAHSVRFDMRLIRAKPSQLSGGLKQRAAIARAFAGDPKVVVCDEPTSALDVSVQAAILNLLAELQVEKDTAYLFISHDLGVVRYLSDRIAVLYLGRLMELGEAETVFSAPQHPYTEALLSTVPQEEGKRAAAHQAAGRDPEPRGSALGLRLPHPLPALHRRHLQGARSRSSRRSSPGTSGAATTRSRTCASCRRRRLRSARTERQRRRARMRTASPARSSHPRGRRGEPHTGERRARGAEGRAGAGRRRRPTRALGGRALRLRAAVLERVGRAARGDRAGARAAAGGRGARAPARQRRLPLGPERDRRHRRNPLPGGAGPRGRGGGRGGRARRRRSLPGRHVVLSWLPACGECAECRRELPHLCRAAWAAMATGGLLDGTSAAFPRRRAGVPLLLSVLLRRARRRARAAAACRSRRRCPSTSPRWWAVRSPPAPERCGARPACGPGERVCVFGCGGVGMSAITGRGGGGGGADRGGGHSTSTSSSWRCRSGPRTPCRWAGGPEETAERVDVGERWRGGLRHRGHRPHGGGSGRVPVDPSARRGRADRHPERATRSCLSPPS